MTQAQYRFSTIDVPGAAATAANGNSTNEIVGQFDDADGTHGFVLEKGAFTTIDAPDADVTVVSGVNALGQIAGFKIDSTRTFHGFFKGKGDFMPIDPLGSVRTIAFFINAQSQVVGVYREQGVKNHGFIWRNGTFTTLNINVPGDADPAGPPPLSQNGTVAIGINDIGEVVGNYVATSDGRRHGFLRSSKGDIATFDVPGAELTVAQGINNAGTIVGLYDDLTGRHGFVLKNPVFMPGVWTGILKSGDFTQVDVPGAQRTEIYSINAKGEIVGAYFVGDPPNDVAHGFGFLVGVPGQKKEGLTLDPGVTSKGLIFR